MEHQSLENRYVTEDTLSKITKRSKKSLQKDRIAGTGIPYIKLQGRVLYDIRDIEAELESCKVTSTSQYAGQ